MMKISFFLNVGLFLSLGFTCLAQSKDPLDFLDAPEITDQERKVFLRDLLVVARDVESQRMGLYSESYTVLQESLSSDKALLALYEKCCRTLGKNAQGKVFGKAIHFRSEIGDMGKADMVRALRIQAQYLVLSIRASQAEEPHEFFALLPEVIKFIERVIKEDRDLGRNESLEFLYESVQESVFARALKLSGSLKVSQPWAWRPMDVQALYEKSIIPAVRKADSLNMLKSAWQSRLRHERILAERRANKKELEIKLFEREQLPVLYWQRAQDFYKAGDQRVALDEMLRIIQENRYHKNSQSWIALFRALLQKRAG